MILFMRIKKQTIVYVFCVLLVISIAVICLATKEAKQDVETEEEVQQKPITVLTDKIILIDAGHGGFDAGASANGIEEKNINLAVALKLKDCINDMGGRAVLTRESDTSTADANRKDGSTAKASDLKRRKAMAEECGADIMISIHMNKFEQSEYWGAQVFYAENSEESKILGETIQAALPKVLNDNNDRVAKKSNGQIYILKNVKIPTVIVECGFLSNPSEAKKLSDEEYQKNLAGAICVGIEDYFNKKIEGNSL